MAVTCIEGFEGFGTATGVDITALLHMKYAGHGTGPYYLDTGRLQGFSIYSNTYGQDQWLSVGTNTTNSTLIFGFGFKVVSAAPVALIYFFAPSGVIGEIYHGRTTGELTVYAANLSTILGTTSGAGLTYGSGWHYVEVKIVVGTAGSVEIRVDGSQRLLVTSVNTTNAAHDAYYSCINFDIATQYRIDDIYVADGSGTLHNSFLGAQTVIGLLPAADTAVEQWQSSSAVPHSSIVNSPAVVPAHGLAAQRNVRGRGLVPVRSAKWSRFRGRHPNQYDVPSNGCDGLQPKDARSVRVHAQRRRRPAGPDRGLCDSLSHY